MSIRVLRRSAQRRTAAARTSGDDGFSLIEVIVAIVLFVMTATAGAIAIFGNQHASLQSQQRVHAANLAQSFLAAIRPGQAIPSTLPTTTVDGYGLRISISPDTATCAAGGTRTVSVLVFAPNASPSAAPAARADSVISC